MSEIKCPNIKIYKCSDGFVTDNAQVAKSHEANIKSNKLICPFCGEKIEHIEDGWCNCKNRCTGSGSIELWLQFLRTRKALDYAIDVIQTVAKMSDKLSREYGETLVEQLDNIQAYCWQEGYVLTHKEDLERAITALEKKSELENLEMLVNNVFK